MINKFFSSAYVWWLIVTIIYVAFNFNGHPIDTYFDSKSEPVIIDNIAGFFGLFAPFGIVSATYSISPLFWPSVLIFLFGIYYFNEWLYKKDYKVSKKIVIIICGLLLLTMLTDAARLMPFASWSVFITGKIPYCC